MARNSLIDKDRGFTEKYVLVDALIDTGAGVSIIDKSLLDENIEIRYMNFRVNHLFIQGIPEVIPVYKIGLDLLTENDYSDFDSAIDVLVGVTDLTVYEIPGHTLKMIIGRDVLSKCIFTYNGINNTFTLDHKI